METSMSDDRMERLRRILVEHLGVEPAEVQPDTTMVALRADSLDVIELVMACEEAFGIEIADDEVPALEGITVADILALVERKLAEAEDV